MPTRFSVVCDDDLAREIRTLAREYDVTEEEVLRQLIDAGMQSLESAP
jgi:predicted transcriptional regulator